MNKRLDCANVKKFMLIRKTLTEEAALQKVRQYCAYQERCHSEVKEKLYSFGLYKKQVESIISKLIEDNYLNEERFAVQFAGGKFRMKQWGKKKIEYELKQKNISSYCIKVALKQIDENEYTKCLNKLAETKWNSLKGQQVFSKMAKTQAYLMQKGYESSLIQQQLQHLSAKK